MDGKVSIDSSGAGVGISMDDKVSINDSSGAGVVIIAISAGMIFLIFVIFLIIIIVQRRMVAVNTGEY